jgi:cell division protein FtsZ
MIHFDLPKEKSSIIKVIGVGGGGSNAVNYMHSLGISGVDFIVCNTDAQALSMSKVANKIQLGPSLTQGLGAGANPEIGRQATEESLEEIRRILEVNTKMAFVTAGMGGGTGTGGAPIIANICRELGILTVGIVTTPFSYEGKKRIQHATKGIEQLKSCVDTLLVISNDKLRHQFGNLTMSAALSTADNVLATAAKCITDVIGSTGQINVDFADVCTVMRKGGVAILGSGLASGEDRAQVAIQQALNSPLLDNSDIRGAKWVLININSSVGEHEFTMDEVDTIQEYLISQAGSDTEVILGLGYDESLADRIGITIIATGFDDQGISSTGSVTENKTASEDKVTFTLDVPAINVKSAHAPVEVIDLAPEKESTISEPVVSVVSEINQDDDTASLEVDLSNDQPVVLELNISENSAPVLNEDRSLAPVDANAQLDEKPTMASSTPASRPLSSGFLVKPQVIYASEVQQPVSAPVAAAPIASDAVQTEQTEVQEIKQEEETMQLVYKEPEQEAAPKIEFAANEESSLEIQTMINEDEVQKAKAAERLYKLRNLSYNFNAADPNNEYENIPAYVRHNLQVNNSAMATVEKFYSNYSIETDDNNNIQISTINTFLEGKKPD